MTQATAMSRQIRRAGAVYTLRRETAAAGANSWTQGATTYQFFQCYAFERGYKSNEIAGGIVENDVLITVDAASLATTPKKGDRIALGSFYRDVGADWREVISPKVIYEGGLPVVHKLQTRL